MGQDWRESSRHIWERLHSPQREQYLQWCDYMQAWQDARDDSRSAYESLSPDEQRRRDIESGARVPLPRANIGGSDPLENMLRQRIHSKRAADQSQREREMAGLWREIQSEAVLALERLRWKNYEGAIEFGVVQGASSGRPITVNKIGWTISHTARTASSVRLATDRNLYRGPRYIADGAWSCYEVMTASNASEHILDALRKFAR